MILVREMADGEGPADDAADEQEYEDEEEISELGKQQHWEVCLLLNACILRTRAPLAARVRAGALSSRRIVRYDRLDRLNPRRTRTLGNSAASAKAAARTWARSGLGRILR